MAQQTPDSSTVIADEMRFNAANFAAGLIEEHPGLSTGEAYKTAFDAALDAAKAESPHAPTPVLEQAAEHAADAAAHQYTEATE